VNGTGDAVAIPDVATFSFTVTETAKTVVAAQSAATTKSNTAIAAVKAGGVADKDIQTLSYSIDPHYDYQNGTCVYNVSSGSVSSGVMIPSSAICPPGKSVLTGYDVSESIQVKVRDLSKAGDLFSSIGSLGVENVNGLSFSVDKPDAVQAQARSAAIADAQSKANELAKELGVHIVRITSFNESNNQPGPIMYAMDSAKSVSAPAASPQIPAGEQKVTDNVTITYEIE